MMEEKRHEENNTNTDKKWYIIAIIILLILLFLFLILSQIIGKVGYVNNTAEYTDIIHVTENDIGWNLLEELNIFKNKKYNNEDIIAPGDYGVYSFSVNNTTDDSLIYDVQLREINKYGVNMKYKLKLENVYVAGDSNTWKDIDEVNLESVIVAPKSTNVYTLEWYWEDSDEQDTKIGQLDYADYTLRIKIGSQIYYEVLGDGK